MRGVGRAPAGSSTIPSEKWGTSVKRRVRRAVLAGLSSTALLTSLSVGATSASAIDPVPCGPEFLKIQIHYDNSAWGWQCFANAGEYGLSPVIQAWVTRIETGNNRVQWYGDGRWQPAQPIEKWTTYTWPNYSGGVRIDTIKIV
ncbi:beta/gamma crystallin domain-containing protein [Streptomyces flaveolus]|uniref:beta/gamma crystallin domain-containing protein n=1 Tax=Streptomyces flaveolus TaxID=67297 RepID=UPI0034414DDD